MLTFPTDVDVSDRCWRFRPMLTFTTYVDVSDRCWRFRPMLTFTTGVDVSDRCWRFRPMLTFPTDVDVSDLCWRFQPMLTFPTYVDVSDRCWRFRPMLTFPTDVDVFYTIQLLPLGFSQHLILLCTAFSNNFCSFVFYLLFSVFFVLLINKHREIGDCFLFSNDHHGSVGHNYSIRPFLKTGSRLVVCSFCSDHSARLRSTKLNQFWNFQKFETWKKLFDLSAFSVGFSRKES